MPPCRHRSASGGAPRSRSGSPAARRLAHACGRRRRRTRARGGTRRANRRDEPRRPRGAPGTPRPRPRGAPGRSAGRRPPPREARPPPPVVARAARPRTPNHSSRPSAHAAMTGSTTRRDAHGDGDRLPAREQQPGALCHQDDVEREQHRHHGDADACAHAPVARATWPGTPPSTTGRCGAGRGTRMPMSRKLSSPTTTPRASRAAARATRMPGAYASAGSTVSWVNVSDSPGPERSDLLPRDVHPVVRSEWIGTLATCWPRAR